MANKEAAPRTIHRLLVRLEDVEPPIWRRLEVDSDTKLDQLHRALQNAMGWDNAHLHTFYAEDGQYSPEDNSGLAHSSKDETKVKLSRVAPDRGSRLGYVYDFGDGWEHAILVEEVRPAEAGVSYPRVVDGERACPPEDIGGPWGYDEFLAALSDPTHPQHAEYLEWGGEFDPEAWSAPVPRSPLDEDGGDIAEKIVRTLVEAGEMLPRREVDRIVRLGAEAVPALLAAFLDERYRSEEGPGFGAVPVHAAELLGLLKSGEAIAPLIEVLKSEEEESLLAAVAIDALASIGAPALEPVVGAFEGADLLASERLEEVAAGIDVKDERIYARLTEVLARDVLRGTHLLLAYGDPRAIPLLERCFDEAGFEGDDLLVIADAILGLGGTLSPEREERALLASEEEPEEDDEDGEEEEEDDEAEAEELSPEAAAAAERLRRLGRNDPCWCGGDAKYKKCHLRSDEMIARGQ